MTPLRPAVDRLPTLTEVVEYEGDAIRVRSIASAAGRDGVAESLSTVGPMLDADSADEEQAAALPAEPPRARLAQENTDELERRLADALDARLGDAFRAIFERAAETAQHECRELMLEAVRDLRRRGADRSEVDGIAARPPETG